MSTIKSLDNFSVCYQVYLKENRFHSLKPKKGSFPIFNNANNRSHIVTYAEENQKILMMGMKVFNHDMVAGKRIL